MPDIVRGLNLRVTGGKGGLDSGCAKALQEIGSIYLSFIGGGATLLTRAVEEVLATEWTDMIAHYHLTKLRVNELGPAVVGIDAHGNSLYDKISAAAQLNQPRILEELNKTRVQQTEERKN
jgi:fumarate hydratase subunit beta